MRAPYAISLIIPALVRNSGFFHGSIGERTTVSRETTFQGLAARCEARMACGEVLGCVACVPCRIADMTAPFVALAVVSHPFVLLRVNGSEAARDVGKNLKRAVPRCVFRSSWRREPVE